MIRTSGTSERVPVALRVMSVVVLLVAAGPAAALYQDGDQAVTPVNAPPITPPAAEPDNPPGFTPSQRDRQNAIAALSERASEELEQFLEEGARSLPSVVLGFEGNPEYFDVAKNDWQTPEVGTVLAPGTVIETGSGTWIGIRVGVNATILVDSVSSIELSEVEKEENGLNTKVLLKYGRIDIKMDSIEKNEAGTWEVREGKWDAVERLATGEGAQVADATVTGDFTLDVPSSTMAVRGTGFGVRYGGFSGTTVQAARFNRIKAIELNYVLTQQFRYYLSGGAISNQKYQNPAVAQFVKTLGPPAVSEDDFPYRDPIYPERIVEIVTSTPPPVEFCPQFPEFTCIAVASVICTVRNDLESCYDDSLRSQLGTGDPDVNFDSRLERAFDDIGASCENISQDTFDEILEAIARFCNRQYSGDHETRCNSIFLQEVSSFLPIPPTN